MRRAIFMAAAVLCSGLAVAAQEPRPAAGDPLTAGLERIRRAEYAEALADLETALDTYAHAHRLADVKPVYMRLFVGNRLYSNVLMKAMKAWVEKHETDDAGLAPDAFASFRQWVEERHALAAATINLVHNSPDWK